jgi:hypothetical protein
LNAAFFLPISLISLLYPSAIYVPSDNLLARPLDQMKQARAALPSTATPENAANTNRGGEVLLKFVLGTGEEELLGGNKKDMLGDAIAR